MLTWLLISNYLIATLPVCFVKVVAMAAKLDHF